MLQLDLLPATEVDRAATIFHRDGFVAIRDALTPAQLKFAQAGAARVIQEQTDADPERKGNRGSHRYSFNEQSWHPEWAMLMDLPGLIGIVDKIWGEQDYTTTGAGGDYSLPGAKIQPLHADMGDFLHDPQGLVTVRDVPAPFIVINFLMVDFTRENGAIRFVPGTQRSRAPIPSLEDEPEWMRNSIVCAPAGTALIRDVRCWHGGTANTSNQTRPMTSVGYFAPWFRGPAGQRGAGRGITRALHEKMSPRARELTKGIVRD